MPKTTRLPDATLVRRSQQGDRGAFAVLAGRYDWRLRGLAHALLLDRSAMDAVLGIAYVRAWRDIVRIHTKDDVGAWLYRLTYNACIDELRRAGDRGAATGATGMAAGLVSLPVSDRVAVVLVDREGFTPESAARILGVSPSVVATRLELARARLAGFVPSAPATGAHAEPVEPAVAGASPPADTVPPGKGEPGTEPEPVADGVAPGEGQPGTEPERVADGAAPGGAEPERVADGVAPGGAEPEPVADGVAEPVADGVGPGGADVGVVEPVGGDSGSAPEPEPPPADASPDDASPAAEAAGNGAAAEPTAGSRAQGNGYEPAAGANGERARDDNRGRGRRARRRAKHAASQRSGDGRAAAGDDGAGDDGAGDAP